MNRCSYPQVEIDLAKMIAVRVTYAGHFSIPRLEVACSYSYLLVAVSVPMGSLPRPADRIRTRRLLACSISIADATGALQNELRSLKCAGEDSNLRCFLVTGLQSAALAARHTDAYLTTAPGIEPGSPDRQSGLLTIEVCSQSTGARIRTGKILVLNQPRLPLAPLQHGTRGEIRTRKNCVLGTGRIPVPSRGHIPPGRVELPDFWSLASCLCHSATAADTPDRIRTDNLPGLNRMRLPIAPREHIIFSCS